MISQIKLRNFQCHENEVFDLDPVTTFVGINGAGKTAVLRALYWICFGRPLGEGFITYGADGTVCSLEVDGVQLARRRKANQTVYRLAGRLYRAIGTGVPDEVANLLAVGPVNFQRQLDPPFWITDSPGQVSKNLNEIVNLELIDTSLTSINSQIRKARTTVEVIEDRIKTAKQLVNDQLWLMQFDVQLEGLEFTAHALRDAQGVRQGVSNLLGRLRVAMTRETQLAEATSAAEGVLKLAKRVRKVGQQRRELTRLLTQVQKTKVSKTPLPDLKQLAKDNADLITMDLERQAVGMDATLLNKLINDIDRNEHLIEMADYNLATAQEELRSKSKGRCPICKQKIPSSPSKSGTSTCHTTLPRAEKRRVRHGTK